MEVADIIIINARELLTPIDDHIHPKKGDELGKIKKIPDGAIAIKNKKIIFVGTTRELNSSIETSKKTQIINARDKTIIPGLIDCHNHLLFAGTREDELLMKQQGKTYMEILAQGGGIMRTVRATRSATENELIKIGLSRINELISNGTTTCEAKSGYGLNLINELKLLKVIKKLNKLSEIELVSTFLGAHVVPEEYKNNRDEYIHIIINEMLPVIVENGLTEFCDVFCENGVFDITESEKILKVAKNLGLDLKLHADEFSRNGGAILAGKLGATSADHLLESTYLDFRFLSEKNVVAVLLPLVPMMLFSNTYLNGRKLIEHDAPLAIATDFNPNCFCLSLLECMRSAFFNLKLTPEEILTAVTLNAAYALNRSKYIGSLEVGKYADIVILNRPYIQLFYQPGSNPVEVVIKNGKIIKS